ncbi:unnamed protein product [Amoebophrya sp. A120]|nr:unnamed protein product [Amoebophrya sp. A120]|eukprot:GSA120T00020527001.1
MVVWTISTSKLVPVVLLSGAALVFGEMHTPSAPPAQAEEAGSVENSPSPRSFAQTKKVSTGEDPPQPVFSANVTLALQVVNDPLTPIASVLEIFKASRNVLLLRAGADADGSGMVSNQETKDWCAKSCSTVQAQVQAKQLLAQLVRVRDSHALEHSPKFFLGRKLFPG